MLISETLYIIYSGKIKNVSYFCVLKKFCRQRIRADLGFESDGCILQSSRCLPIFNTLQKKKSTDTYSEGTRRAARYLEAVLPPILNAVVQDLKT